MNPHFKDITLQITGAKDLYIKETIQSLWSGYGSIVRIGLKGSQLQSAIAKHVQMPKQTHHPRGWNTDNSHLRKVKSYEVETSFYKNYAHKCTSACRVPIPYLIESENQEIFMLMEDLDASGFGERLSSVSWLEIQTCLSWLAHFHATFINETPRGLWQVGTYWHLSTRPDELAILKDKALKQAAPLIDQKLNETKYQTLVHGDAKLANFCFSTDGKKVAAVDFQYVGGGCGMKDVAYFIGSCLHEDECEKYEQPVLDYYFKELKSALLSRPIELDFEELESQWRALYPVAWTDFHRFLKGWSPGHWKINSYSERLSSQVLKNINIKP